MVYSISSHSCIFMLFPDVMGDMVLVALKHLVWLANWQERG